VFKLWIIPKQPNFYIWGLFLSIVLKKKLFKVKGFFSQIITNQLEPAVLTRKKRVYELSLVVEKCSLKM